MLLETESYKTIGACMTVHRMLGNGFLESVYQEALEKTLKEQEIPFERKKKFKIQFGETDIDKYFVADFVVLEQVKREIKAIKILVLENQRQVINYQKASGLP